MLRKSVCSETELMYRIGVIAHELNGFGIRLFRYLLTGCMLHLTPARSVDHPDWVVVPGAITNRLLYICLSRRSITAEGDT